MFQLNKTEFEQLKNDLIFQNGISSWGGTRKLPYAFTEQGLAMLSGVLNSDIAISGAVRKFSCRNFCDNCFNSFILMASSPQYLHCPIFLL